MKSTNKSLHIILIVTVTNVVCSDNRLKVSVYYESLCPYSIDFIKTKIFPHYKEFQNYVRLEWIPYGKANQTLINGKWSFKCQHGRDECKSNMYQACGLDQGRSQERNIEFINCVVSLINPAYTRGIDAQEPTLSTGKVWKAASGTEQGMICLPKWAKKLRIWDRNSSMFPLWFSMTISTPSYASTPWKISSRLPAPR
ncbi:GILT-like protein 1 isoform X2 [Coccinella septempunctata]|uniref:GILT-like protein 1 isoform X2 n=1 Tax=Coccinella septempunctata TaxID=41139 RepID=UPI001D08E289|nr:GILT-like protein 1 isoform X2 [Coccinella septempunctata]